MKKKKKSERVQKAYYWLFEPQIQAVKKEAKKSGKSQSELVRNAITVTLIEKARV